MGQVRALPGQVVVVQQRGAAGARGGHDRRSRGVQGEGAQVLHDDEVCCGERRLDLRPCRARRCVHGQPREDGVDRASARHRADLPPEDTQRSRPFRGFDRDAVAATQSEGDHACRRHDGTLGVRTAPMDRGLALLRWQSGH